MPKIPNLKYKRNTVYKLDFPTLPSLTKRPTFVDLIQKQNQHDILVLKFFSTNPWWFNNVKTGLPVKFIWSQGGVSKSWYGYVSFITKTSAPQKVRMMEVYCIGSSFVLKGGIVKVFSNMTVTQVVKEIAKINNLNYIGESHNQVFEQLTIAGHSYWEWIVEYGKKIGYGVYVDGTNLIFRPIDRLIDQFILEAPILSRGNKNTDSADYAKGNTLEYFRPLNGEFIETSEFSRSEKIVGGVNPISGAEFYQQQNPKNSGLSLRDDVSDVLFSEYKSDQVVHTDLSSETSSKGAAALARFTLPAFARTKGDPKIRPYSIVYINQTGRLTDGYWMVKEVTHKFAKNKAYELEMTLVTDGTGETTSNSFRESSPNITGILNLGHMLSTNALILKQDTTVLHQSGFTLKQYGQGYMRTPARWVTTIKG